MTDVRHPRNPTELRRALSLGRAGQDREVHVTSRAVYSNRGNGDHCFEVKVHPGSNLRLVVHSGLPFLKAIDTSSDRFEVTFDSVWGNSLEIMFGQGARVVVIDRDRKVTLTGDGRDLELVRPQGKDRVRQFTHTDPEVIERNYTWVAERTKGLA